MPGRIAELSLRDGTPVLLRRLQATDRAALAAAVERLSADTLYKRFASPKPRLTQRELDLLVDLDHRDREALVAIDPATRQGIAVVRYVRVPGTEDVAEVAATVVDEWQGRGVGTLMIGHLACHARRRGFRRLRATVLAHNHASLTMLRHRGFAYTGRDGSLVELELEL